MQNWLYFTDPGHGWVKVPYSFLKELKIEKEISCCSYYNKGHVFLEEDSDLTKFYNACLEQKGEKIKVTVKHTDRRSKIRNFEMYNKDKDYDKEN